MPRRRKEKDEVEDSFLRRKCQESRSDPAVRMVVLASEQRKARCLENTLSGAKDPRDSAFGLTAYDHDEVVALVNWDVVLR